jgi:hypothetical protein
MDTPLSAHQLNLLNTAAEATTVGIDQPASSAKTVNSLVKRGYLASLAREGLGPLLTITAAGRAVLDPPSEPMAPTLAAPELAPPAVSKSPSGKIGMLIALLSQPSGADVTTLMAATGWQAHSVRGAISGAVKKRLGLAVVSEKTDAGRIYRIAEQATQ